jgi:hypothetical protein
MHLWLACWSLPLGLGSVASPEWLNLMLLTDGFGSHNGCLPATFNAGGDAR